jgi:hypothetical protein
LADVGDYAPLDFSNAKFFFNFDDRGGPLYFGWRILRSRWWYLRQLQNSPAEFALVPQRWRSVWTIPFVFPGSSIDEVYDVEFCSCPDCGFLCTPLQACSHSWIFSYDCGGRV